jgi:hypothetical protein
MPWHNHARDSRPVSTSQHGAKIARIGHPVAHQEEWVLLLKQRLQRDRLQASRKSEDSLVAFGTRFAIQSSHGDKLDRNALSLGLEFNGVEDVGGVLRFCDEDSLD